MNEFAAIHGRRRRVAGVVFGAVLILTGRTGSDLSPSVSPASDGHDASSFSAALESAASESLVTAGIPSAVISVKREGEELWSYVFNAPDLDTVPVAADSMFGYRSVTKSFTVTVVLMLADEGHLSLDDSVATYLDGVPGGESMTIRDLAGMRSGLANYSALPAFGELLNDDPSRSFTDAELTGLASAEPLVFESGSEYMYSNTNTVLLGQVIEQITGRSWADAVDTYITGPLGLTSVRYPSDGQVPGSFAVPYQVGDAEAEELPVVGFTMFSAAGGLVGTVSDLAAWADALGTGDLLRESTQTARIASLGPTGDDPQSPEYDAYGLGLGEIEGWVGHTGTGIGFQSLALHDPASGTSIAILLNSTSSNADLPADIFKDLLPALS